MIVIGVLFITMPAVLAFAGVSSSAGESSSGTK